MVPVKAVLKDSGLRKSEIKVRENANRHTDILTSTRLHLQEVVLVGGSTRIPFVRKMLRSFFGYKYMNQL